MNLAEYPPQGELFPGFIGQIAPTTPHPPRRRARAPGARRQVLDALSLPLFDTNALLESFEMDVPRAVRFGDPEEAAPTQEDLITLSDKEATTWSDRAIEQLHSGLLEFSLKSLGTNAAAQEKLEVLEWIFAPDVYVQFVDGRPTQRYTRETHPFSFAMCCALEGYDPDRLRDLLLLLLPPVVREAFE